MQILTYVRKYYPLRQFAVFTLLCVLQGCIPAVLIPVESHLIDNAICGLTHKDSYKDIFVTSVIIPILVTALVVIGTSILYT